MKKPIEVLKELLKQELELVEIEKIMYQTFGIEWHATRRLIQSLKIEAYSYPYTYRDAYMNRGTVEHPAQCAPRNSDHDSYTHSEFIDWGLIDLKQLNRDTTCLKI